jgi:LPXTG-motif cell wall-anchored protein
MVSALQVTLSAFFGNNGTEKEADMHTTNGKLKTAARVAAWLALCIFAALAIACVSASAQPRPACADPIDTSKTCTLTVKLPSEEPKPNLLNFSIYKVADIDNQGNLSSISSNFKDISSELTENYTDEDEWGSIAQDAYSVVVNKNLKALSTQKATISSPATFTNLTPGIYLVHSDSQEAYAWGVIDFGEAFAWPFLIKVPMDSSGKWTYNITGTSKTICDSLSGIVNTTGTDPDPDPEDKDPGSDNPGGGSGEGGEGGTDPTPDPDPDPDPDTPSKTPEDFDDPPGDGSVSSTDEIPEDNPHDETGGVSDNPPNANTTTHVTELVPVSSQNTPGVVTSQDTPKLPQTGMQLWLVPLLLAAGLALVAAGLVRRRAGHGAGAAAGQGAGASATAGQNASASDTFDTKTAGGSHILAQNAECVTSNNITSPPTPSRDSGRRA